MSETIGSKLLLGIAKTEARKIIDNAPAALKAHGQMNLIQMLDTLLNALEAAEAKLAEREWISVKVRLPKDGQEVLLCSPEDTPCVGRYYADLEEFRDYEEEIIHATHWMPLPEPHRG